MTVGTAASEEQHVGPAAARRMSRPAPVTHTAGRHSMSGAELGEIDLDPEIFGIEPNSAVLHQVVTAQQAAARSGTQSTKTRAEVRGGGAKPYRQKGTGRARQGSTRAPQFIGGGVALGPKPRSYAQRTPRKMVKLALHSALSDRAAHGRVVVIDAWSFDVPRTKEAVACLEALEISGRVLLVLGEQDGYAERSFANLPHVRSLTSGELNAYEVLVSDWVVFTDETLPGARVEVPPPPAGRARRPKAPATSGAETASAEGAAPAADTGDAADTGAVADTETDTDTETGGSDDGEGDGEAT